MERNCKNCKFFKVGLPLACGGTELFPCYDKVPFPEVGCRDFISKPLLYSLCLYNRKTRVKSVLNIFDDLNLAKAEQKEVIENICKRPSSDIKVYICPCFYSDAEDLANHLLIDIVNIVAQNLLIADRGFKKGFFKKDTFEKSQRWFEFAHRACRRGAAILDVINND